jgi:hypothetical protein
MSVIHQEKIIIDKSYFKRKSDKKSNKGSVVDTNTLEEILESIYQTEYLDSLDFKTESDSTKDNNRSNTTLKAKKKYFN